MSGPSSGENVRDGVASVASSALPVRIVGDHPGYPELERLAQRLGVASIPVGDKRARFMVVRVGPKGAPPSYDAVEVLHALLDRLDQWESNLERVELAELARDRLAEELAVKAMIAPPGTRWPRFTLPDEHKAYAVTSFCGQTVFAGGADIHHARRELARELVRKAEL